MTSISKGGTGRSVSCIPFAAKRVCGDASGGGATLNTWTKVALATALALASSAGLIACKGGTLDTRGADQAASYKAQIAPAEAILVPDGYRAVQVVEGLNFPSSMAWDDAGRLYILESHSVPVPTLKPKILRVAESELEEVRFEGDGAPTGETAVGLAFRDG